MAGLPALVGVARDARRWRLAALAAAGVALASGSALAFRNVTEGSAAPDFSLPGTDGQTYSLGSFQGKCLVLAFVRQGQERSTQALADLARLDPALSERARVAAVVLNPSEGDPASWASGAGATYPVLLDKEGHLYGRYGVLVAPSTGVIDPSGAFRAEVSGHTGQYRGEVEGLVRAALGMPAEAEAGATTGADVEEGGDERKVSERHLEQARLLAKRRMVEKAVASAREAVGADPTHTAAHVALGQFLLDASEENAGEAGAHFEKALELSSKDADAKAGLARVKSIGGDHQGAAQILEDAVQLNPKPERLYYELGRVYERAGEFEKAVGAYRKALERLIE